MESLLRLILTVSNILLSNICILMCMEMLVLHNTTIKSSLMSPGGGGVLKEFLGGDVPRGFWNP